MKLPALQDLGRMFRHEGLFVPMSSRIALLQDCHKQGFTCSFRHDGFITIHGPWGETVLPT